MPSTEANEHDAKPRVCQGNLPWDDACEECMEFLWFKQGKFEYPSNMSPGLVGEYTRVSCSTTLWFTLVSDLNTMFCSAVAKSVGL